MTDAKRNIVDLEKLSEIYDGEHFDEAFDCNDEKLKSHLDNWSLIGSALLKKLICQLPIM